MTWGKRNSQISDHPLNTIYLWAQRDGEILCRVEKVIFSWCWSVGVTKIEFALLQPRFNSFLHHIRKSTWLTNAPMQQVMKNRNRTWFWPVTTDTMSPADWAHHSIMVQHWWCSMDVHWFNLVPSEIHSISWLRSNSQRELF